MGGVLARAGSLLVVALLLTGCSQPAAPTAPAGSAPASLPASTPAATPASSEPVAALSVGDCTGPVDLSGGSISSLEAVPCAQPHYYEVHATVPITGELHPGAAALATQADTACSPSFVTYIGVEPEYSRYGSAYLVPDEAAWDVPANRVITCLAGSAEGGFVGSAKGDATIFPEVGQCTGPQNVPALEVQIIDCAAEHSYEVFAATEVKGAKAPTKAEEDKLFNSVCVAGFKKFVGVDAGKSVYEVTYFLAGENVWDKVGDHRIVCSAGSPKGGIKGSLKGEKK